MNRRSIVVGALAAIVISPQTRAEAAGGRDSIALLETRAGGRLGIAAVDTSDGRRIGYREDERFPMCSTFKLPLVAAVLARVDGGHERLERRITYSASDVLKYAPITRAHVDDGAMTVGDLCAAAIRYSDNTAANLLLTTLGGPSALTGYVRSLGDTVTRFDRTEPALNTAVAGDPRDTSTPRAMCELLSSFLVARGTLGKESRSRLARWLTECKTGNERLRAGLPAGWHAGDKTGSGDHAATNDVAVVYPPGRAPVLICAYFIDSRGSRGQRNAVIAEIARIASRTFSSISYR